MEYLKMVKIALKMAILCKHCTLVAFCTKNEGFDQTYLNTGSKTQNVEKLSLDLTFYNNFW